MTPGARIQAAVELLSEIWRGTAPPDVSGDIFFRRRRYAGSSDRRAINERVYNVLRRRAKLDWWIERTGTVIDPDPRSRIIADLAAADRTSPDRIEALFSGARHCPASLSAQEAALAGALYGRPLRHRNMPRPVVFEYPAWMDASFTGLWGDRLETELAALNRPAPVDLRVNTLKTTPDRAAAVLRAGCVDVRPTPFSPLGLRVVGRPRLGGTEAFKKGLVEIQDEGSQLLAFLVGARPGMTVVDFCAGAGGKTLALAAAMGRGGKVQGRLFACDVSASRMERMRGRIKRAGVFGVKRRIIAATEDDNWVAENAGRADRVLADAPCTGTGTWRRDAHAKWRLQPADLEGLIIRQRGIMTAAATLVKAGGRLVYATCSLLPEENERQVAWFLGERPEFRPLCMDGVWAETIGGPPPPGPGLRLSPASTGTDGFFCAVLERLI